MYVEAVGRTDRGLVRPSNEDTFVIADLTTDQWNANPASVRYDVSDRGVLVALADGMGGAQAGEVASALAVESLREHLGRGEASQQPSSVASAVKETNRDIWVAARMTGQKGMGTTLAAVLINRDRAHIASVGDSRAYIIRGNRIRQITKDQSFIAALLEAGYAEEDVKNSPFRGVVLQAMGTKPDVVVALGQIALRSGDVFLLCSDGLWEKVSAEEMFKEIVGAASYAVACANLVELANRRGGEDNITVVVAQVAGDALPALDEGETVTETYESLEEFDFRKPGA